MNLENIVTAQPLLKTHWFNNHHHRALRQSLAEHSVPHGITGSLELDTSFFRKAKLFFFIADENRALVCICGVTRSLCTDVEQSPKSAK